ncbi:zinc finger, CCHC-type, retrotransposon gag domain protein [Tanacetum coccineum]
MVNTRTDAELAAAVQAAVDAMLPQIREQVREEYRTGAVASGSNPPPVTIHTWLERFNKQKPRSFEKAVAPVDAENWISHMEKIFDVMDCNDAFKTRLAVYKFEGDALAWWKAYKQAKGGDAWVLTLTWAAFKELFFLQFFPRAEQERLKREYHSIRQRASENSTEYMQRFLRLAGFLGQAAGTAEEQAKNFRWGLHKSILSFAPFNVLQFLRMLLRPAISPGHSAKKITVVMIRIKTVKASTHGKRNSGAGPSKGSQQSRVPSEGYTHPVCNTCERRYSPGECTSCSGTCSNVARLVNFSGTSMKNIGVQVLSVMLTKSPDASGRVFALTQDQAANLKASEFPVICVNLPYSSIRPGSAPVATIDCHSVVMIFRRYTSPEFINHGTLPGKIYEGSSFRVKSTPRMVSEFQDIISPEELPGIPLIACFEFNIELFLELEPISKAPYRMAGTD